MHQRAPRPDDSGSQPPSAEPPNAEPPNAEPPNAESPNAEPPSCRSLPVPRGLWDGREQDACGIGFIADIEGRAQRRIVVMALEALANLTHRGATGADGKTSDGTGVLTQIPWRLLRRKLGSTLLADAAADDVLALGFFFLPAEGSAEHERCRRLIESACAERAMEVLGWRAVPTNLEVLGDLARQTCPAMLQLVLRCGAVGEGAGARATPSASPTDDRSLDRRLLLVRKRIENQARAAGLDDLAVVSLSHRTVVYKSMAMASELGDFYLDLQEPDFESAVALFHQRFSTNTQPTWRLAQPFRMLAHNGEINTIQGNLRWMRTRESQLESELWGDDLEALLPVLDERASDSAMLDQMLEMLVLSGRHPLHAMMMLVPEASRETSEKLPELRAFYEYHATLLEPWDGPAAVVLSDGRIAAAALDRNGLRPQRYWQTVDGLVILGSEAGMVRVPEGEIVAKGRLGPGEMLAVDMERGELLHNGEIKRRVATRRPYGRWLEQQLLTPPPSPAPATSEAASSGPDSRAESGAGPGRGPGTGTETAAQAEERLRRQKAFGYSKEAIERIFDPMLSEGKLPVGSMGNDAPLAVLSTQPQLLYSYFKQRFAQVTNPPIDPIRERLVFDLGSFAGGWANLLEESPEAAHLARFPTPILDPGQYAWLRQLPDPAFRLADLDAVWPVADGPDGLLAAVRNLMADAEAAVDDGASLLILGDRGIGPERAAIPMLLATAAVHNHLVRCQKRMKVTLICDTGEPREDHHFACLLGFGATLIYPRLAFETVAVRASETGIEPVTARANYLQALEKGLLKVLSRLGVCPMSSYHGAQLFEILGLDDALVHEFFPGTRSRVGGVGPRVLAADVLQLHSEAFEVDAAKLVDRGLFRFRKGGEHHGYNPQVFKLLHRAVRQESSEAFGQYAEQVDRGQPTRLRDLLAWRRAETPLPLDAVEPASAIARRFCTAAMSLGALSKEAHEVIAIGMNRIGGRSNSGEGGEDPARYSAYGSGDPTQDPPGSDYLGRWQPSEGDWGNSAIKQIASGRFGVDPYYLSSARELEIKMAQGSKPGEGGQIPGQKVTPEIARLRNAVPGAPLISPPPHHDIYSIEDLAQLIHDLKRVNPRARVGVKLVSLAGVGTIACGVVKAGADYILISGDDGGTGASPLSSIKHAGMPWELGLAETQQQLVRSGLRERVSLRVDGGLKTGRDLALAALLGAEEFGFGTAPLVAIGCVMARQCHLDTCPVGVATQREDLRSKFPGTPEHVVAFMLFVAEQVRHVLASMGFERLDDVVGRFDLLDAREDRAPVAGLHLGRLLADPDPEGRAPRRGPGVDRPADPAEPGEGPEAGDRSLDQRLWRDAQRALATGSNATLSYPICNQDRSVGARLSGELARITKGQGLPAGRLRVDFEGVTGQSFGVFLAPGLDFRVRGEAQDYVGKGMAGGRIALAPPESARLVASEQVIAGNTLLYGATGGRLFAAGRVGERFCVRNSGARAVVEGCGDHGCEYMTAGVAVILGPIGRNFGAGMSGGRAYLLDPGGRARARINPGSVVLGELDRQAELEVEALLVEHEERTGSELARRLLARWPRTVRELVRARPRAEIDLAPPLPSPEEVATEPVHAFEL